MTVFVDCQGSIICVHSLGLSAAIAVLKIWTHAHMLLKCMQISLKRRWSWAYKRQVPNQIDKSLCLEERSAQRNLSQYCCQMINVTGRSWPQVRHLINLFKIGLNAFWSRYAKAWKCYCWGLVLIQKRVGGRGSCAILSETGTDNTVVLNDSNIILKQAY